MNRSALVSTDAHPAGQDRGERAIDGAALLPSAVLDAAADLIEPEGRWIQQEWFGNSRDGDSWSPDKADCWCAEGAICRALAIDYGPEVADTDAERFLVRALNLPSPHGVPDWNDRPGRTQAEVVAALRRAAALARSEGQ